MEIITMESAAYKDIVGRIEEIASHVRKHSPEKRDSGTAGLLDGSEVMRLLSISRRTLQRYRSDGLLPYRMHRHKTYYRKSDVEMFITTHMKEILRDRTPGKTDAAGKNSKKGKTNRKK